MILLDLLMPNVDGFSVLKKIREKNALIPIIVLTNLSMEEDQEIVMKLGATKYLVKSNTTLAAIAEAVNNLLQVPTKTP